MTARSLDEKQRASLLDRLFRRIGSLDDETLLQLEVMTRGVDHGVPVSLAAPPEPAPATTKRDPEQQSRRYFLLTLVAGGTLAAVAGGAGAVALNDQTVRDWLRNEGWLPTPTDAPPTVTLGPSPIPTLPVEALNQIGNLQSQLATVTSERDSLQSQLNSLTGQYSTLQTDHTVAKDLIALYQQLEAIGIDAVIVSALASLGMPILALDTVRQALSAGVVLAVRALSSVETQLPFISAGLDWLDGQVTNVSNALITFQATLQVAGSTPAGKAATDFVNTVLDLLPFGAGQNIKQALVDMGNVIAALPVLINETGTRLLQPARALIVSGKVGGIYDLLIQPIRDQVLTPAQQIVANAENLNNVYNSSLAQPAQSALDQRAVIRAEITKKAGALSS